MMESVSLETDMAPPPPFMNASATLSSSTVCTTVASIARHHFVGSRDMAPLRLCQLGRLFPNSFLDTERATALRRDQPVGQPMKKWADPSMIVTCRSRISGSTGAVRGSIRKVLTDIT